MNTSTFHPAIGVRAPSDNSQELPAQDLDDLLPTTPINRDMFFKQCMGNVSFAAALLEEFQKSSQSRLDAFNTALRDRNSTAIASEAHALKGIAGILTANVLAETCCNMELAVADGDWEYLHNLAHKLFREVRQIIDLIPTIRASV